MSRFKRIEDLLDNTKKIVVNLMDNYNMDVWTILNVHYILPDRDEETRTTIYDRHRDQIFIETMNSIYKVKFLHYGTKVNFKVFEVTSRGDVLLGQWQNVTDTRELINWRFKK